MVEEEGLRRLVDEASLLESLVELLESSLASSTDAAEWVIGVSELMKA